ncbi:MAG: 4Fe-4S dicluster domain-containing protein [Planctomycetales bacterium]|nr:4Fe-4S dicluster domain-containing protein [Planctomycetales bacterium]
MQEASTPSTAPAARRFLAKDGLHDLFAALQSRGYQVVGPTIDQEAIVYDELRSPEDLPRGWTDVQEPGSYRLQRSEEGSQDNYFDYVVGPYSWKRFLYPPRLTVSVADLTEQGWQFSEPQEPTPRYAFLGVRACELHAIQIQDRVFLNGEFVDPEYQRRREEALIIAVNCTRAAPTCFCTSMNTGPKCDAGFDLALTELKDGFVIESATQLGEEILAKLTTVPATDERLQAADAACGQAVAQIQRRLDTEGVRDLLLSNLDHPRWKQVAERCLSCTNCTMVCPTCFCASVDEVTDLSAEHVERRRQWDSCFNPEFSYIHGGNIRDSIPSRYRQWLTHKLGTWIDQFGVSGCVGCGRCITWCPPGIDLTEEVAAIREEAQP